LYHRAADDGAGRTRFRRGARAPFFLSFLLFVLACEARVESPYVPGIASPLGGTYARSQGAPRGLWVLCECAQRVLEHEERLEWLLDDAQAMGVSDLFVQVYRGGRAWFDSELADPSPYAKTWRSPRGDALTTLIARAHERGLRVHAWMNALSLSSNSAAPVLTRLGRDAVIVDQHGRSVLDYPDFDVPPGDRDYYRIDTPAVWLDPAAPGVAGYLEDLVAELLNRHPALDGIHLDYIRYPTALPFSPGTRFGVGLSFGHGECGATSSPSWWPGWPGAHGLHDRVSSSPPPFGPSPIARTSRPFRIGGGGYRTG
jgi:uncharacterized lipoprotein YddW (UPF0748 family)